MSLLARDFTTDTDYQDDFISEEDRLYGDVFTTNAELETDEGIVEAEVEVGVYDSEEEKEISLTAQSAELIEEEFGSDYEILL